MQLQTVPFRFLLDFCAKYGCLVVDHVAATLDSIHSFFCDFYQSLIKVAAVWEISDLGFDTLSELMLALIVICQLLGSRCSAPRTSRLFHSLIGPFLLHLKKWRRCHLLPLTTIHLTLLLLHLSLRLVDLNRFSGWNRPEIGSALRPRARVIRAHEQGLVGIFRRVCCWVIWVATGEHVVHDLLAGARCTLLVFQHEGVKGVLGLCLTFPLALTWALDEKVDNEAHKD